MKQHRNSAWIFDQFGNRHIDAAIVHRNGNVEIIEAKATIGQQLTSNWSELCEQLKIGTTFVVAEGKSELALLHGLKADIVLMAADEGSLEDALLPDPPELADFLIDFIPLKHRENLPGDLAHDWNRLIRRHGPRRAIFLYWVQVGYVFLGFLAQPLAGIVGIGWIREMLEIVMHKLMK